MCTDRQPWDISPAFGSLVVILLLSGCSRLTLAPQPPCTIISTPTLESAVLTPAERFRQICFKASFGMRLVLRGLVWPLTPNLRPYVPSLPLALNVELKSQILKNPKEALSAPSPTALARLHERVESPQSHQMYGPGNAHMKPK